MEYFIRFELKARTDQLRCTLTRCFGEIPDAGPKRGLYYKSIRSAITDNQCAALIGLILNDRVQGWSDLRSLVPKKANLGELVRLYHAVE